MTQAILSFCDEVPLASVDALSDLPLFQGLTPQELDELGRLLFLTELPERTRVFKEAQIADVIYIIVDGTIKLYLEESDGTSFVIALLGPGDTVGEMSMIESLDGTIAGRSATVVTLAPCSVVSLDRAAFQACLTSIPVLATNLLRMLSQRLRNANILLRSIAREDVPARVARQLLLFAHAYGRPTPAGGVEIRLRLQPRDLASLVQAQRAEVETALSDFTQQGIIARPADHRVTITNRDALAARCR